jgi:hypothetical protein
MRFDESDRIQICVQCPTGRFKRVFRISGNQVDESKYSEYFKSPSWTFKTMYIPSGIKKNKATFVDQAGKVFPLWGIWVRKFAKQPEIDELQTGNWILETGNKETGNRKERPFD